MQAAHHELRQQLLESEEACGKDRFQAAEDHPTASPLDPLVRYMRTLPMPCYERG